MISLVLDDSERKGIQIMESDLIVTGCGTEAYKEILTFVSFLISNRESTSDRKVLKMDM